MRLCASVNFSISPELMRLRKAKRSLDGLHGLLEKESDEFEHPFANTAKNIEFHTLTLKNQSIRLYFQS
jgi:hypothetical protein